MPGHRGCVACDFARALRFTTGRRGTKTKRQLHASDLRGAALRDQLAHALARGVPLGERLAVQRLELLGADLQLELLVSIERLNRDHGAHAAALTPCPCAAA